MQRDLTRLANERFDLLVIGGGITGACIARDATLRGLAVALVEKNDFANATSAHNSKLIHGGLRYLRNLELGLVRESLLERRIWQRIAGHLVRPLPFLVPLYGVGWKARATLAAGLTLYDLLSFDRGWQEDPAQRLPGHRWLDAATALAREPALEGPGLQGAFEYHDAQMYSPERMTLECLLDAAANGAAVANYVSAEKLLLREGRVEGATVSDGSARFDVRAAMTVIAAGPWADIFLAHALGHPPSHRLMRSKGIHLIVPAMTQDAALTVATQGGHFFVLPWRGHSLLGTTDTTFNGSPDMVGVSERDIAEFLAYINANLHSAQLARAQVEHFYAGLRPLVDDGSGDTYDASRRAELIDHGKEDGVNGLFSAIGGKWTTSRHLAEQAVDVIVAKLGRSVRACLTATAKLPGTPATHFEDFLRELGTSPALDLPPPLAGGGKFERDPRENLGEGIGDASPLPRVPRIECGVRAPSRKGRGELEHLARLYGRRLQDVLACARQNANLREPLSSTGDIGAQVLFAIRKEMALTLEDVVMRRTGVGQLGNPGTDALARVADLMATELGWDDGRRQREIETVNANFRTVSA